ncbi:hypothetical protein ABPG74_007812 [Tetrahymena malaccensis]
MIEAFKRLDIFTQPIQFNSIEQITKKRTLIGALLSTIALLASLSYFVYYSYLYLSNQIDPIFRSQAFVRNDLISIPLQNEFIAFQYIKYMSVEDQQIFPANKTYITYVARYQFQNSTNTESVVLDIAKCQNPMLDGYLCVDFSKLTQRKLMYDFSNNIMSSIMVYAYRCDDMDQFKQFIPDNCASSDEINAYISQQNYVMVFKVQQQQFNTTSKQMDKNYKNQFIVMDSSQVIISEFKIQLQNTEVIEGPFIQKQNSFSSPSHFQGQYLNILKINKVFNLNASESTQQEDLSDSQQDENPNQILIPNMKIKQKNINDLLVNQATEIQQKEICLTESIQNQINPIQAIESENQNINQTINFYQNDKSQTDQQKPFSTQFKYLNLRTFTPTSSPQIKRKKFPSNFSNYTKKIISISAQTPQDKNTFQSQQIQPVLSNQNFYQNLKKKLNAYSSSAFASKIHKALFKFKIRNKEDYQISQGLNPRTKQFIQEQFNKSLDFINLQKEILFLKKAIMILLSKDQYAMIPLIGCSNTFFDFNLNISKQNDEKKQNYFEEILTLSMSKDQQYEQIHTFLAKCLNQQSITEIDQRILSSVI